MHSRTPHLSPSPPGRHPATRHGAAAPPHSPKNPPKLNRTQDLQTESAEIRSFPSPSHAERSLPIDTPRQTDAPSDTETQTRSQTLPPSTRPETPTPPSAPKR